MLLLAAVAAARSVPGGEQVQVVDAVEVRAAELPGGGGGASVRDEKNFIYGGVGGFAGMGGYCYFKLTLNSVLKWKLAQNIYFFESAQNFYLF